VSRIAWTGLAASALALGFALPAHADTPPDPGSSGVPPAEVTAPPPTPPDTDAAAVQTGATNVNVSIRVGSPGDNGSVSQTISSAVGAALQVASVPAAAQVESTTPAVAAAAAEAAVVQAAPVNVDLSVRLASPGNDGAVTQTIAATAAAAAAPAQYQPPTVQYQPPTTELSAAPTLAAPASSTPPTATADATSRSVPGLPTTWTWNWTWTCGGITGTGITQTIDTGIQNWVWNWNLGGTCAASSPLPPQMPAVIQLPQSGGAELVLPTPPTPPTLPALPTPTPPVVPAPFPALVQAIASMAIEPVAALLMPAAMPVRPLAPVSVIAFPMRPATPPPFLDRYAAGSPAGAVPAPRPRYATPAARHREQPNARRPVFLLSSGFMPPSSGGGVASGGGGAGFGAGITAALAIWILLALPGIAVLRLPASRRGPRAHVDDTRSRPG
jgi:hypothetical protein